MTADGALKGWICRGTVRIPGEVVRVWSRGDLYDDMEEVVVVGGEEWERLKWEVKKLRVEKAALLGTNGGEK